MGQRSLKKEKQQLPTPQELQKSIDFLFGTDPKDYSLESVIPSILIISKNLRKGGIFEKKQDGFYVNQSLLRCLYNPQFENMIKGMIILLSKELKSIMQTRLIALVSRQKFMKCLNLANFCIFFTDQNLIQSINLLGIKTDLQRETKQLLAQLTKNAPQLNLLIFSKFQLEELVQLARIFQINLAVMIDLHLKLFTRSDFTLKIVDDLNQSVFILFCKIYFCSKGDLLNKQKKQNFKNLAKISAYFLGLGIEKTTPSIYETSVVLLLSVLQASDNTLRTEKALPSHLFKNIPIINSNQIIDWITYNTLYALKYIRQGTGYYSRLNVNRIPSLKLLELIFQKFKPTGNQITYMVEQLCLQTKVGHIERVYMSSLAEMHSQSEGFNSQIIKKYCQTKNIKFNVKSAHRSLKVKPEDIKFQLHIDQQGLQKEMAKLCARYVMQVIFHRNDVLYEYSDRALWTLILSNLHQSGTSEVNINADEVQEKLKQELND